MKEPQFVNPEQLETLEQYGAALLSSMISLRTLEAFHIAAWKKGLLEEDEEETSKTICWEIRRLMSLYQTQLLNVMERAPFDQEELYQALQGLTPEQKLPRKRKK